MKFAFITSIVPDGNPSSGFEIANDAIINALRAMGHDVTIFGFRLPRQGEIADQNCIVLDVRELENVTASISQKLRWLVRSMTFGLPYAAGKLKSFSAGDLQRLLITNGPFDATILNSYQMPLAFPQLCKRPYIYVAHNVEHRTAAQNALHAGSVIERFLFRRDAELLQVKEPELCANAGYVWTFSEDDLNGLDIEPDRGCVLPLVAPMRRQASEPTKPTYDIGLIGTWSWQANLAGLSWFLEEVVPQLAPERTIAVAGSVPDRFAPSHPSVALLGRVDSASQFLDSVRVVPLISQGGTGVQLKTIEAFQTGHACVATSSSLRGIDVLPENCIGADDAKAFAAALDQLVEQSLAGRLNPVDGTAFFNLQFTALRKGIQAGVNAL